MVAAPALEETVDEQVTNFGECGDCGAPLPTVRILAKGEVSFEGHFFIVTKCPGCDTVCSTVLHFCKDIDTCEIAALQQACCGEPHG